MRLSSMNVHVQLLIVLYWLESSWLLGGRVKGQDVKDGRRSVNPKYSRHSMVFVTPIGHIFIHSHKNKIKKRPKAHRNLQNRVDYRCSDRAFHL